ncbi:MAG: pseudouridine synthase [Calditerrivibrio sp.]|nr:pseudouridine synthase [Calditerrivibrio sp.]
MNNNFYDIVFEDNDIIVLNKIHGVLVIPDRYDDKLPHLKGLLLERYKKIFVVHRLDFGTGGLVVFAKNELAHRDLSMQFEKGEVYKEYYALVKGSFPYDVTCMLPISKVNYHGRYKINFKSGRKAITSFFVLEKFSDRSFLKVVPLTGRAHQIRVHLRALGFPLLQDFLYGERLEDKRLTLQAYFLRFKHPSKSREISFEAPLSPYMKNFLKNC